MYRKSNIVLFSFLLSLSCQLLALEAKPINIEADSLDIDEKQGLSVYKGNVRMSQGDLKLSAKQVIVYTEKKGLKRIVAKGDPVQINVAPRGKRQAMRAQALVIEYQPLKNRIVMQKNAQLWQGKNEFSSHHIEYRMDQDVISAKGSKQKTDRVRVTIHPEDKDTEDKKDEPKP